MLNILGIDFEEWFHPELIQSVLINEKKSFKIVKLNVCDKNSIDEAVSSDLYAIIHLAAINEYESFSNIKLAWELYLL